MAKHMITSKILEENLFSNYRHDVSANDNGKYKILLFHLNRNTMLRLINYHKNIFQERWSSSLSSPNKICSSEIVMFAMFKNKLLKRLGFEKYINNVRMMSNLKTFAIVFDDLSVHTMLRIIKYYDSLLTKLYPNIESNCDDDVIDDDDSDD